MHIRCRVFILVIAAAAATAPAAGHGAPAVVLVQAPADPAATETRYGTPRIVRPKAAETIHDNTGTVHIEVTLRPPLGAQAGHRFRLMLDGALLPGDWATTRFSLRGVDRGTHSLQVIVTDRDGSQLAASTAVEFHMWRASRLFPARESPP